MTYSKKIQILLFSSVLVANCFCFADLKSNGIPPEATPQERRLGEEATKEFEAGVKLLSDHPSLHQLNAIVGRIVPVTERPKFVYTIKVFQDDEPNAFTFPGGFIYLTTGLLQTVQTEHELAAVLAHEIAHNTHLHALRKLRKMEQVSLPVLLSILASVFSKDETAGRLAYIVSLVGQVVILGYSRDMELEADKSALRYLQKANFNPIGMLVFLEKMQSWERKYPANPLPGYWVTHPTLTERIETLKGWFVSSGLPITKRAVTDALKVEVKEKGINGTKVAALLLSGEELCLFAENGPETAMMRAKTAAQNLNTALDKGAQPFDFQIQVQGDTLTVSVARNNLWHLLIQDAGSMNQTLAELAVHIRQVLTRAFIRERLKGAL